MSRPYIEVAMEVEEEKLFLLVVESSPGDLQQRCYDQRGKTRSIIGGLRYLSYNNIIMIVRCWFGIFYEGASRIAKPTSNYFYY